MPAAIKNFVNHAIPTGYPVAAIGCRVTRNHLDCCEYDLAVFIPEGSEKRNQIVKVGRYNVELLYYSKIDAAVDLGGMVVIRDSRFLLPSAIKEIAKRYSRSLAAYGRKSLVSSLFHQQRMKETLEKRPVIAAMWLKVSAYEFVQGMLSLSGIKPLPLHELGQLRRAERLKGGMAEGVQSALECIGVERATRPAISRSVKAMIELKSDDYDKELVVAKVNHLLEKRMLSDCYYYVGRISAGILSAKKDSFHDNYSKLVQLAMDLTSDGHRLEKLQKSLFRAAQGGLKS